MRACSACAAAFFAASLSACAFARSAGFGVFGAAIARRHHDDDLVAVGLHVVATGSRQRDDDADDCPPSSSCCAAMVDTAHVLGMNTVAPS